MIKKTALKFSLGLFFVFCSILNVVPARAVEYGGIGGRPAYPQEGNTRTESIFVHTVEPGKSVEDGIALLNNTQEEKTVLVYAVDSTPSSDGAFACAQASEARTGVGGWIVLAKTEVTIPASSKEIVPFTITVPESANVGESNGCIAIQEKNVAAEQHVGVNLNFRTAIRVAITVPGDIVRALTLEALTHAVQNSEHYVDVVVANSGNVSIDASVHTTVQSLSGHTIFIQEGTYPVLRDMQSQWRATIPASFWGGLYRAQVDVVYDAHAEASIGVDSGLGTTTITQATRWFVMMPSQQGALIEGVVVLLVLIIIVSIVVANMRRERMVRSWKERSVHDGDTLHLLAEQYAISWQILARVNGIKPPYHLVPGTTLRVPSMSHTPVDENAKNSDTTTVEHIDTQPHAQSNASKKRSTARKKT